MFVLRKPTEGERFKKGRLAVTAYSPNLIWDIIEYSPNYFAVVISKGTPELYEYFIGKSVCSVYIANFAHSACIAGISLIKCRIVEGLSLQQVTHAVQQLTERLHVY